MFSLRFSFIVTTKSFLITIAFAVKNLGTFTTSPTGRGYGKAWVGGKGSPLHTPSVCFFKYAKRK